MKPLLRTVLFVLIMLFTISMQSQANTPVKVEWFGHSCFLLTLGNGTKILIDPYDTSRIPYELPEGPVDVIVSTHDHFDHNAVDAIHADVILHASGDDSTFWGSNGDQAIEGRSDLVYMLDGKQVRFQTVASFHDERSGELRGSNGIVRISTDGMTFVHLGDIGTALDADQINALLPVDVLLVPVGGYFTVNAEGAQEIVKAINPKAVLPMHYKTDVLSVDFPITGVDDFLKSYDHIVRHGSSTTTFHADNLPAVLTIELLKYHGQK
ncbi:MAG: MBL fold metallo-hydrolase [bacterium]